MDAPAKGPNVPLSLGKVRKQRARSLGKRFALFVGLPTLLGVLHYGWLASDVYESVSPFTVQSAEKSASLGLESLMGVIPGAGSTRDALAVREYILSRDVLRRLDEDHGFIAHYQSTDADIISRLAADATFEDAYEYYLDHVDASFDSMSSVLTLRVRAFDPQAAQTFAQAIIGYSEEMVNDLAERARRDAIAFAEKEVKRAETRLGNARQAVLKLQADGADLNPELSAQAALTIRSGLQAELAKARAELSQARAFMRPSSAKVVSLEQRVRSLAGQVKAENRRIIDPNDGHGMHKELAKFETALLEKEFGLAAYESALASLQLAHAEAARKHQYLATIAPPSLPDEATHPRRLYRIATVFALFLTLFAIGSLLVAAVREHARI